MEKISSPRECVRSHTSQEIKDATIMGEFSTFLKSSKSRGSNIFYG